jgi:hypothetical protein
MPDLEEESSLYMLPATKFGRYYKSAEGHSADDRTSRWLVGGLEFGRHTVAPQESGTTPIDRPQPRFPLSCVASSDSWSRYLFVWSTASFLGCQV